MTLTNDMRTLARAVSVACILAACAPKDGAIKEGIDKALAGVSGVNVEVTNRVATITGQFPDEAAKASAEAAVKGVKGVRSIVDNATIAPPPAPVVISADDSLKTNLATALKDYPTLKADVKDGVVTLTGAIKKADLPKAMQAVTALRPKKIDNKATVQK